MSHKQDWALPWWVWLVPVGTGDRATRPAGLGPATAARLEQMGRRRTVELGLLAVVSLSNALMLAALLVSLVTGHERSGGELLLKGAAIWGTNVITFGLAFWALDRGGPASRIQLDPPLPDFQFPQQENPRACAARTGSRSLLDYLYLSFTNSIAFSPTDAMPLSHKAKALMLLESAISAMTVLFVAARAINILK